MQNPGQFGEIEQAAVPFQGMDQAEQLRQQVAVVRFLLQRQQFFTDALQRFT